VGGFQSASGSQILRTVASLKPAKQQAANEAESLESPQRGAGSVGQSRKVNAIPLQYIIGQYVRIIGRPELLTIGAIRDGLLFIGAPAWMVEAA
jgi:hypothetical protein